MLWRVKIRSVDIIGTVVSRGTDPADGGHNHYLIVRMDNGEEIRVRPLGPLDFRPGQRGVVKQTTTNFFGFKKHEFKGYLDKPSGE